VDVPWGPSLGLEDRSHFSPEAKGTDQISDEKDVLVIHFFDMLCAFIPRYAISACQS
jgi:hypothetical protein